MESCSSWAGYIFYHTRVMHNKNNKIKIELKNGVNFPDRCIYCGCENPNGTVPLSPKEEENHVGERMIVFAVPACHACAISHAAKQKHIANVAYAVFLVVFTTIAAFVLRAYQSFIIVAFGLLLAVVLFSLDALRSSRPKIAIDSIDDSIIIFHSPDKVYSDEFKTMNSSILI